MRTLSLSLVVLLAACGSLDNDPLRTGTIRGQVTGTDPTSSISVIGREELVTSPDVEGRFALAGVPLGNVELLVVINATQSRRLSVEVGPASVVELGAIEPAPSQEFEVYVKGPSGQRVTGGTVSLVGTPLLKAIRAPEDEAEFFLPPGCYQALISVPGLGTATIDGCMEPGFSFEKIFTFDPPDGTVGREGCSVTGCKSALVCQSDGSCR
jgi:hypothetical protein